MIPGFGSFKSIFGLFGRRARFQILGAMVVGLVLGLCLAVNGHVEAAQYPYYIFGTGGVGLVAGVLLTLLAKTARIGQRRPIWAVLLMLFSIFIFVILFCVILMALASKYRWS